MSAGVRGEDKVLAELRRLVAKDRIRDVLCRYSRGIDRRDFDLVRSCYHPDAVDDHGEYSGGIDGFIDYVQVATARYEHTMHFLGNMLIEVDGTRAHAETYCVASHRLPPVPGKPNRDITLIMRYVDVLEERSGEWRIAKRVCTYDWARLDADLYGRRLMSDGFVRGVPGPQDPVYRDLLT